jgi:hypothetical protein
VSIRGPLFVPFAPFCGYSCILVHGQDFSE